ncbi:hypothetical protein WCLP8_5240005 [uncultured Gammaproteobacteria bacterium]
METNLTVRELADAIVYGRDGLLGLIEILEKEPLPQEILEGVVVRLITYLRYNKEMRHIRAYRRRRSMTSDGVRN